MSHALFMSVKSFIFQRFIYLCHRFKFNESYVSYVSENTPFITVLYISVIVFDTIYHKHPCFSHVPLYYFQNFYFFDIILFHQNFQKLIWHLSKIYLLYLTLFYMYLHYYCFLIFFIYFLLLRYTF